MKKIIFSFICLLSLGIFFSCSDSLPSITEVHTSLVYEFHDEDEVAVQRLVLFIQLVSDDRRVQYLELIENERNLLWKIDNPQEIKISNKKYIGSSEIYMPKALLFFDTQYELKYFDLADRMTSEKFFLTIPRSLRDLPLDKIKLESIQNKEYGQELSVHEIVLYDILKNPLYIGAMTESFLTKESIQSAYPQTFTYREFYRTSDYSFVVLCPEIFIDETIDLSQTIE